MQENIETPWSTVGLLTYKRTYARRLIEEDISSPTENFEDTVDRVIQSCDTQLNVGFTKDEEERLRCYLLGLKGSVAGRFWWQMGTKTVDKLGLASLQNCAFTVIDEPVRPFTWTMDMLMLGSGVGYNIQRKNIDKLPEVNEKFRAPIRKDTTDADFIVPDTREGWVALLAKTLKAAFLSNKVKDQEHSFSFSTMLIRGRGAAIKGFGGTSSGPEDLCWGIAEISNILEKRAGKKIRPIDALDIMNIIGAVVVAGNVRRSAQIAIGDCDDVEFLLAKRWDMGNIPSWRAMSNNSVVCDDIKDLHEYFWAGYEGKGEPYGLINLKLSRKVGRLGETQYPDPGVQGYNPCVTGDTLVTVVDHGIKDDSITSLGVMYQIPMEKLVELYKTTDLPPMIVSYNTETDSLEYDFLDAAALTRENADVIEIQTENGISLKLTPDHKVFTENRGWVEAKDLLNTDALISITTQKIQRTKIRSIKLSPNEHVYDITVRNNHNFFANGILVHNCAEQSLDPYETCCLAEMFLPNIKSKKELLDVTLLLYRIAKHSLSLPCHHVETEEIVNKNMRMGIGLTGVLQANEEQISWLDDVYEELRAFDVEYSKAHGWNPSIKLSTIKPSGTLSLLPGCTPGIHPGYAQYMIRRIRIASNHNLVNVCRSHGYPIEYQLNLDGSEDRGTMVVSFPFSYPEGTRLAKDMTAIDQLNEVKRMQTLWSDNSVSCTVYYKKEELPEIREYLKKNYKTCHKSLSFLLHKEHGFLQAPYEEISKEEYDSLVASTRLITSVDSAEFEGGDECGTGGCPIK